MKVHIENQGEAEIRVIVDRDTVVDAQLEPGAAEFFETEPEGIIEVREIGDGEEQDS